MTRLVHRIEDGEHHFEFSEKESLLGSGFAVSVVGKGDTEAEAREEALNAAKCAVDALKAFRKQLKRQRETEAVAASTNDNRALEQKGT